MFWVYGPGETEITDVGLEPHPEDRKSRGYDRVSLSDTNSHDSMFTQSSTAGFTRRRGGRRDAVKRTFPRASA